MRRWCCRSTAGEEESKSLRLASRGALPKATLTMAVGQLWVGERRRVQLLTFGGPLLNISVVGRYGRKSRTQGVSWVMTRLQPVSPNAFMSPTPNEPLAQADGCCRWASERFCTSSHGSCRLCAIRQPHHPAGAHRLFVDPKTLRFSCRSWFKKLSPQPHCVFPRSSAFFRGNQTPYHCKLNAQHRAPDRG
jgi:hypothetical protein